MLAWDQSTPPCIECGSRSTRVIYGGVHPPPILGGFRNVRGREMRTDLTTLCASCVAAGYALLCADGAT